MQCAYTFSSGKRCLFDCCDSDCKYCQDHKPVEANKYESEWEKQTRIRREIRQNRYIANPNWVLQELAEYAAEAIDFMLSRESDFKFDRDMNMHVGLYILDGRAYKLSAVELSEQEKDEELRKLNKKKDEEQKKAEHARMKKTMPPRKRQPGSPGKNKFKNKHVGF